MALGIDHPKVSIIIIVIQELYDITSSILKILQTTVQDVEDMLSQAGHPGPSPIRQEI